MTRNIFIVILALGLSLSSTALADDATSLGDDEISLKNGGMLRGTIIAVEPGKEATIVVKGKEKTLSWAKIDKVERGKYKKVDKADSTGAAKKPKKKPKKERDDEDDDKEELTEPVKGAPFLHVQATYPEVQLTRVKRL